MEDLYHTELSNKKKKKNKIKFSNNPGLPDGVHITLVHCVAIFSFYSSTLTKRQNNNTALFPSCTLSRYMFAISHLLFHHGCGWSVKARCLGH